MVSTDPNKVQVFGWCSHFGSQDHQDCPNSFTFDNNLITCSCECHTDKDTK